MPLGCRVLVIIAFCAIKILAQANRLVTDVLTSARGPLIDVTAPAYGAAHDGIHDDTAAIQRAVNFAAAEGGTVYLPCGEYLMASNTGVIVNSPKVNIKGQNQACVILRYTGAGRALTIQMKPFTTNPAGEFSGFTVIGTPFGSEGILSGQIVSSHWHDITITGFTSKTANTGLGGAGLHLHNAGHLTTWTERNLFENVSLGGVAGDAYNTQDLLMDSDAAADSFGYNRFLDLKFNVTTGTVGMNLASGFFYNSVVIAVVNMDNTTAGTAGPIAVETSGNWDSNVITLTGECNANRTNARAPFAVQINKGARFANLKGSVINLFNSAGDQLPVHNLNSPSSSPNQTLVERTDITSWDTGSFTLNGVAATPQPIQRANYGSNGLLIGASLESPYVSMPQRTGNAFVIGSVPPGGSIGSMVDVADVDAVGRLKSSTYATSCNTFFSNTCSAPATIDGAVPLNLGGFTSIHRSGLSSTYMQANVGINEELSADPNFLGGIGYFLGARRSHPLLWSYALDPVDFSVYEKSFQTPLAPRNLVFQMTHGGGLGQGASARNIAGNCTLNGTNSCSWIFTNGNASPPICVGSPQFMPSSFYSVTSTTTACIVTFSSSQTGIFNFVKVGNPN